jgi:hypothetical protein
MSLSCSDLFIFHILYINTLFISHTYHLFQFIFHSCLFVLLSLNQDLQHFPHVKMKLKLQEKETGGERCHILHIRLEKLNSRRHSSRAFVPRFPKVSFEIHTHV